MEVIKDRGLGRQAAFSGWAQCNHKGLNKREEGQSQRDLNMLHCWL